MKVRAGFDSGLVPASYVESVTSAPPAIPTDTRPVSTYSNSGSSIANSIVGAAKKKGPAVAPKRGAKKLKYVEALYDYTASSDAEHSMVRNVPKFAIPKDSESSEKTCLKWRAWGSKCSWLCTTSYISGLMNWLLIMCTG